MLPHRCLCCGKAAEGPLCRACLARYQPVPAPDTGLGRCPLCGQVRLAEAGLCVDCAAGEWTFPEVSGLVTYHEAAGELLRLYKFGALVALARLWARSAAPRLQPPGPLVPVPPLGRHKRRRGWDPVETFVRALAAESRLPVLRVLVRRRSASQKTLDKSGRLANARAAYAFSGRRRLEGLSTVWLVDDVMTTGATVEACSRLLKTAGAGEVRVFCLGLR